MLFYVNCCIIFLAILKKGEVIILKTKTITKDTKFYICEYGIFYEGQILEQYAGIGNIKNYIQDVVLDKFIVHFKEGKNFTLNFRITNFVTKEKVTLPVDLLGVNYKIKKF